MTIRYGDLKKQLAADINAFCAPIREKILAYQANDKYLEEVAADGADKARKVATQTIREVREIIGFK